MIDVPNAARQAAGANQREREASVQTHYDFIGILEEAVAACSVAVLLFL